MAKKRKTLMVREDLAEGLSNMAKDHGYTLYDQVNEIFGLVIHLEETGLNLKTAVQQSEILKSARDAGFILGLETLWYQMAELAYEKARDEAVKRWFEAGVWLAKRYVTAEVENPFERFKRSLEIFTWNAPEFTVEVAENAVSIRVVSPRFPESYTTLYAAFLEGALGTFEYKIVGREVSRGTIRLKAVGKGEHVEE